MLIRGSAELVIEMQGLSLGGKGEDSLINPVSRLLP